MLISLYRIEGDENKKNHHGGLSLLQLQLNDDLENTNCNLNLQTILILAKEVRSCGCALCSVGAIVVCAYNRDVLALFFVEACCLLGWMAGEGLKVTGSLANANGWRLNLTIDIDIGSKLFCCHIRKSLVPVSGSGLLFVGID